MRIPWVILVAGCSGPAVRVERLPGLVNAARFQASRPFHLECQSEADPEEVHVVDAPSGDVTVFGLLADQRYHCEWTIDGEDGAVDVRTDPLPDGLPVATIIEDVGLAEPAYTLMSSMREDGDVRDDMKLVIFDRAGRIRWYTFVSGGPADLDAQYLGDGEILYGGGYSVPPTLATLGGEILWKAEDLGPRSYNHHAERLPSGDVLTLVVRENHDPGDPSHTWNGFAVQILDPQAGGVAWEYDSQRAVDAGILPIPLVGLDDPYHANSVSAELPEDPDAVWVASRGENALLRIDRTTFEITDVIGAYRGLTLTEADGSPASDAEWAYKPHAPELHLPRILYYDNGVGRPVAEPYSQALELTLSPDRTTAAVTWEWTEDGWYEPIWGDIDELADGRIRITRAHCGQRCADLPDERTQVVEVERSTGEVTWRMRFDDVAEATYRSAAIDGCDVFADREMCP